MTGSIKAIGSQIGRWAKVIGASATVILIGGSIIYVAANGGQFRFDLQGFTLDKSLSLSNSSSGMAGVPEPAVIAPAPQDYIAISELPERFRGESKQATLQKIIDAAKTLEWTADTIVGSVQIIESWIERRSAMVDVNALSNRRSISQEEHRVCMAIQHCLMTVGMYDGEIDGQPGRLLPTILKFQRDRSIPADGIVGRQTWYMLKTAVSDQLASNRG